jgi:hypothetical protein
MDLVLDDFLKEHGVTRIGRIKNNIVIINSERILKVKFNAGQTPEGTARALDEKLDKRLGRELTQYIILFICKPKNWDIISASEAQLKQKLF